MTWPGRISRRLGEGLTPGVMMVSTAEAAKWRSPGVVVVRSAETGHWHGAGPQKQVTGACSEHAPRRAPTCLGRPEHHSNRPSRARRQVLDRAPPLDRGGEAGELPVLRRPQPARRRTPRATRSWAACSGPMGPAGRHGSARGRGDPGPPLRLPALPVGHHRRSARRPPAPAVLGGGGRAGARAVERGATVAARRPPARESVGPGRRDRGAGLGEPAPVGACRPRGRALQRGPGAA